MLEDAGTRLRPSKPHHERRRNRLHVFLTDSTMNALEQRAARERLYPGTLAAAMLEEALVGASAGGRESDGGAVGAEE